jgi:hypothetical protein
MQAAIVAARRGQRNYADPLFRHVEAIVGAAAVAAVAPTFHDGAPPRSESERSAQPTESEIVIRPGANTAAFDVDGDAAPDPTEDKFGMTRQSVEPPAR